MSTDVPVPSVTPEDLLQFHVKHFEKPFRGALLSSAEEDYHQTSKNDYQDDQFYEVEEDDSLGYYPDGIKRTITDEQIAIFRHSEVQRLLLKQQRQAEAEAELSETESMNAKSSAYERIPDPVAAKMEIENVEIFQKGPSEREESVIEDDDDDEEYARFLENEREQFAADAKQKRGQIRDRQQKQHNFHPDRAVSTRRRVRELDDVDKQEDVVLDY